MKNLHILIPLFLPTLFLFSCFLSLVLSFSLCHGHLQNQCLDDQRAVLLQLHHDLYYAPNFTFSSKVELWDLNTDCCAWKGITCDALGHVIGIDLSYKNLSDSFQSIFNLHHLQLLNLAKNNFNTTLFQYEFDRLSNLTHLNLSNSCFHGQIPVGISHLTRLVSLDLSNQDSCYIRNNPILDYGFPQNLQPLKLENPNFKTLIQSLGPLTELYLDSVNISTQSTEWCEATSIVFPNLHVLSQSNCGLTGAFCSSLLKLPFLSKLFLNWNSISYLPSNFLKIASPLAFLSLMNCNLSEHFPTAIFLLPKIESIDISLNLSLGDQFPEFSLNNALRILKISCTNFSGKLPESIGNLKFLTNLDLNGCKFFGQIPSSIANLTNLVELDLSNNNFSGFIPAFHRSGVPALAYLYLYGNYLSGSIHSSLFTLPSLQTLVLSENQLFGEIDEFLNASSSLIETLNFGYNSFSSLKLDIYLSLQFCNLSMFPEFLKSQTSLEYLDLSNNKISDAVPNWVWKKSLRVLDLSNNSLSYLDQFSLNQSLTSSLGSLSRPICNLSQLETFNASFNKLSGPIPSCLGNISSLSSFDLQKNNFSGSIPDFAEATQLYWLQLNDNKLEGKLPMSLANCTILRGKLPALMVLVLQANRFYGPIKHVQNYFQDLDVLDIAFNNFSGQLPIEFFQAPQLRSLKIGGNKLEGKLPRSLAHCTKLEVLNVGKNMIHDIFPFWLVKLPSLKVLILRANRFYGPIKISKDENAFIELHILDLASNNFSGELTVGFFQSLKAMRMMIVGNQAKPDYIGDNYYQDSMTIVNKGFELSYKKILTIFACLDLSRNPRLCGPPLTKKCDEVGLGMPPPEEEEDSWVDGISVWKIVLIGYGCGLVIGLSVGHTVLNEMGNKWMDRYNQRKFGRPSKDIEVIVSTLAVAVLVSQFFLFCSPKMIGSMSGCIVLVFCSMGWCFSIGFPCRSPYCCIDDQKYALLQLNHDLYYAPNFTFSSKVDLWDPNTDCCSWKRITRDALGHLRGVARLSLVGMDWLKHRLVEWVTIRSGVPNLAYVYLLMNHLFESVHSSLFTLSSLHNLYLGRNQLVGEIREFLNASSSLIETLSKGYNSFTLCLD
ncbi:receptor-like protein 12 [Durio zibethinus]|uniref:Receptor-like protein 12 n=1 Tax=Durio zibethinus TaxID=66656 RepID=A0A6P5X1I2_DURZI|nr:receptor-like protein 12 [Durio zibethinus]